jgi:hypothetical protein
MLRFIDRNIITTLDELQITIYNQDHKLIYTNLLPSPKEGLAISIFEIRPSGYEYLIICI